VHDNPSPISSVHSEARKRGEGKEGEREGERQLSPPFNSPFALHVTEKGNTNLRGGENGKEEWERYWG